MKKHLSTIFLLAVFFVGLAVLLYPAISNYINQIDATYAVSNYDRMLTSMNETQYETLLEQAQEYNRDLAGQGMHFVDGEARGEAYQSVLNVMGDGMMGYISIKRLGVMLPIYHGTSEAVLATSAGHLEGSSLPIGGENTHSLITGHRGLPAAKLFTDLDKLEPGDTFTVTVLNQTLMYEVDQVQIVLPEETENLGIIPGGDYVTLVTCTPYAVNTHRLLVRGIRTDAPVERRVEADAVQIDPVIVAPIVAAPFITILFVWVVCGSGKKSGRKNNSPKGGQNGGSE